MGQENTNGNLSNVGTLASHIGSCNNVESRFISVHFTIVSNSTVVINNSKARMSAFFEDKISACAEFGSDVGIG